jgi:excisionase family DNA binding protein
MISESGESECISLSRAAKILGVCVRTVRREIERRKLIAFRVGRSPRIRMSELRRYMEEQTMGLHV